MTRRSVAIKILANPISMDWALLDAETEKLAFLAADRRVVQLLDVGRDADPPHFVMEYVSGDPWITTSNAAVIFLFRKRWRFSKR